MQLLFLSVGAEHYAIESRRVVEVVPLVAARPIPRMPDFIRGVFAHRGRLVPLVDLARRLADQPLRETLSTRVVVVEYPADAALPDQPPVRIGIAAENVVSLGAGDEMNASSPLLHAPGAAYLGRLLRIGGRTVQWIAVEHLVPPEIISALAPQPPATATVPTVA
ncbi:MAG: chemotaxis protein CheW [Planctomycetia bacterium]